VYFVGDRGVYALDAATGAPRWAAQTGTRMSPAVAEGRVIVALDSGRQMLCFKAAEPAGAAEWPTIHGNMSRSGSSERE
jgi:hypothetical protein